MVKIVPYNRRSGRLSNCVLHWLFTPITWVALSAGALWAGDSEVGITGSVIFTHNKAFADGGEKGRGMHLRYRFKGLYTFAYDVASRF